MKTLIIPSAGKSSRFPGMKPKWLLTHPDGKLMIFQGLKDFPVESFDRIIVTIHRSHIADFEADTILLQATPIPIELCVLEEWTAGPAETIQKTILQLNVNGGIVVKDSDNAIEFRMPLTQVDEVSNFIVGVDINKSTIYKPESKSYLVTNSQRFVTDIVEKRIVSGEICAGVYGIASAKEFILSFEQCKKLLEHSEIYLSHIISHMISSRSIPFEFIEADKFEDWGTLDEWKKVQSQKTTYFVDFDGVLVRNSGKYGTVNWDSEFIPLDSNLKLLSELVKAGAQIVITTARDVSQKERIKDFLVNYGVYVHSIVYGLNHAPRSIINDFAPTNPFPSATAINLPRNGKLEEYLN